MATLLFGDRFFIGLCSTFLRKVSIFNVILTALPMTLNAAAKFRKGKYSLFYENNCENIYSYSGASFKKEVHKITMFNYLKNEKIRKMYSLQLEQNS